MLHADDEHPRPGGSGRRGGYARASAVRQARAAVESAQTERVLRHKRIEAALADYFEAASAASRIRLAAEARAEKVLAAGDQAAAVHDRAACKAIAELRGLGEVNARIADMCGITVAAVRLMAAAGRQPGPPRSAQPGRAASGGE
jgi:hypothetical protein